MRKIDEKEFDELLKGDMPFVCDFSASWCGPCKMLAPVMEETEKKFEGKAVFADVDVDENMSLAMRYNITAVPTVIVFKGGETADTSTGFMSKSEAEEFVKNCIS